MRRSSITPIAIVIGALVVLNIVQGRFSNIGDWMMQELIMLPAIVIGISFHEFAHGFVSYKLGDPTPKLQGRVTLNPAAHIDPIGFICLLFAGFGWGNPVQIDPRYYKHRRRDEFLVAIAGVVMNFLLAVVFTIILRFIVHGSSAFYTSTMGSVIIEMIQYCILINLVLMIFNLIPVPPLDGFGILTQIFNLEKYSWYPVVYQNGMYILLALILFNVTDLILNPAIDFFSNLLINLIVY